jgi:hypothetical protein
MLPRIAGRDLDVTVDHRHRGVGAQAVHEVVAHQCGSAGGLAFVAAAHGLLRVALSLPLEAKRHGGRRKFVMLSADVAV